MNQTNVKTSTDKNSLSAQVFQCIAYVTHKCKCKPSKFHISKKCFRSPPTGVILKMDESHHQRENITELHSISCGREVPNWAVHSDHTRFRLLEYLARHRRYSQCEDFNRILTLVFEIPVLGACGFHENPLDFKFGIDEEKRIYQIVLVIDKIVSNILLRSRLCGEIKKFKVVTLTNLRRDYPAKDGGWGDTLWCIDRFSKDCIMYILFSFLLKMIVYFKQFLWNLNNGFKWN